MIIWGMEGVHWPVEDGLSRKSAFFQLKKYISNIKFTKGRHEQNVDIKIHRYLKQQT